MSSAAPHGTDEPPAQLYDVALLDLDGVVYLGATAIEGVPRRWATCARTGMRLAFVTNNASRTPAAVRGHAHRDGRRGHSGRGHDLRPGRLPRAGREAAGRREGAGRGYDRAAGGGPRARLHAGVLGRRRAGRGGPGLRPEHRLEGPAREATVAVRRGAWYVATNLDSTVPSARGPLPGNGALVGVVAGTTGVTPTAVGKPDPAMHRESVQRSGAERPIVVGDRLDTDIEGASRVGCDSMLVLTGVTTAADLLVAVPEQRPTYVAGSVRGLLEPQPGPERDGGAWTCGGWRVEPGLALRGDGDHLDALRALCAAAWDAGNATGSGPSRPCVGCRSRTGCAASAGRRRWHRPSAGRPPRPWRS